MSIYEKKHFCYIPFDGLTIDPRGLAQLCPVWRENKKHSLHDFTQSSTTLEKIFNGDDLTKIRQKMLNDEYIDLCSQCYSREGKKLESKRLKYANERNWEKNNIDPKIRYLDISFSNKCNLACSMCNSTHSSHWHHLEKSMPLSVANNFRKHYDKFQHVVLQKEVLESIFDNINDLELITIKGGEPLYDKNCLVFLEKISNIKPSIKIKIVSNITSLPKQTIETFNKLKNLEIFASIDGIGNTYNWIRGTNFAPVEKNFQTLLEHPNISVLGINFVLSIYNVGNIINTLTYFSQYQNNKFDKHSINVYPAVQPYLSANLLLDEHKNNAFKNIITEIQESAFAINSTEIQSIENIIFNVPVPLDGYSTFKEFTTWMNGIRKFNIQDEHNYIKDII